MLFWIVLIIVFLPITIFLPTRIVGRKNLPKGKAIYACNHQTNADIFVIGTKLRKRIYALAKAEIFKSKISNWFFKGIGGVKINRGKADIQAIKDVLTVLNKKQKPIVIFPTGTRNSSPEEVQDAKNGVAMFALKSKSPIIPMVLIKKPRIFRFNKLVVGKPLDLSKYENMPATKEVYAEISKDLVDAMEKLINENTKPQKDKKHKENECK